jgi:Co/Zn/Cd efflux system component
MQDCCENKSSELIALRGRQGRTLKLVLAINAIMFVVEATAGLVAHSAGLLADSLDMFGDAAVYALTLYVLDRGPIWKGRAAFAKGVVMALFGGGVLVKAGFVLAAGRPPAAETMGVIGGLALAANLSCLLLLLRHRSDDLNMSSTWLCSRNDIIANVGVLAAAGTVAAVKAPWPDALAALIIAGLFLKSAVTVTTQAHRELRVAHAPR